MLALSSVSSSLQFRLVTHTSIYENSELKVFKSIKFLDEISNNYQKIYWEQM